MYTDCRIYGLFQRCQVTLILCLWVIVAVVTQVPAAESPSTALRCGIARADITPTKPVQMAGYSSRKELSQGIHDPLSARVVAFECGGKRAVLVSLDNLGFYNDTATQIRAALLERCKLEPSELLLCAIHTHSAPTLTLNAGKDHPNNVEYTKTLTTTIGDLIERALKSMEPVSVGARRGYSPIGMNRREKIVEAGTDGKTKESIRLGRNAYGPTDKEVLVMKIAKTDGTAIAAIFDYACHSTSLGPGNMAISGDVHGLAEQFVEQHLGAGLMAPAFAGASGDIDPWFRVVPGFKTNSGWIPEPVLLSTMLGEEVVNVYREINVLSPSGPVRTAIAILDLPAQSGKEQPSEYTGSPQVTITAARIGDTAFIGFGCEILHALGLEIKLGSPFAHTFLITHCNGAAGYLAPAELYAQGGYEIQTSPFAAEAAARVVERAGAMLRELYKNE
jgi:hypothetical protein